MEAYIGAVFAFGFNFAPANWALCSGQLLPIEQYQALFALIGTTYGGNGQTNFALPNLEGRVPIGAGQGPGLPTYTIGEAAGSEYVTLIANNLPSHSHPVATAQVPVNATADGLNVTTNNYYGLTAANLYAAQNTGGVTMHVNTTTSGITGSNQPLSILNPYQTVNYCICLFGIFPSRN